MQAVLPKEIVDIQKEIEGNVIKIEQTFAPIITDTQNIVEELEKRKTEIDELARVYIKVGDQLIEDVDKKYSMITGVVDNVSGKVKANVELNVKAIAKDFPNIDFEKSDMQFDLATPTQLEGLPSISDIELGNIINFNKLMSEATIPLATITDTIDGKLFELTIAENGKKLILESGTKKIEIRDNYSPVLYTDGVSMQTKDVIEGRVSLESYNANLNQFLEGEFKPMIDKYLGRSLVDWNMIADVEDKKVTVKSFLTEDQFNATFDFESGNIGYWYKSLSDLSTKVELSFDIMNMREINMSDTSALDANPAQKLLGVATVLEAVDSLNKDWNDLNNKYARYTKDVSSNFKSAAAQSVEKLDLVEKYSKMAELAYNDEEFDLSKDVGKKAFQDALAVIWQNKTGVSNPWTYIDSIEYTEENKNWGYVGYVVKNNETNKVYMLHRGTEPNSNPNPEHDSLDISDIVADGLLSVGVDVQTKYAEDLYSSAKAKGITGRVIHIGHSLGGGMANIMAAKHNNNDDGDIAFGFNSAGAWPVLKKMYPNMDKKYYEQFIENYNVETDVVPAFIQQVGTVYLEKGPENKPDNYSMANFFTGAAIKYEYGSMLLNGNVLIGLVSFVSGGYAGESHSLKNFQRDDETGNRGIEGIDLEGLSYYNQVVLQKYWLAYELLEENKLGENSVIEITANDNNEISIGVQFSF